jgi:hypothetical protein
MVLHINPHFETMPIEGLFIIFFAGIAVLLYVITCIATGNTYLHPKHLPDGETETREDYPGGFWMTVVVFLVFGLFLVISSGYYILIR